MTNQEQAAVAGHKSGPAAAIASIKQESGPHYSAQRDQQQTGQVEGPNCCASCQMPIKDRFIFNVINQNFHQNCVRCADCSVALNEKCYTQDGKQLYCRLDYWRRYGPKCSACCESIKPTELVQKLKQNLIYHLSCFVCQDCKRHLEAGEQLHLLDNNKILCKRDYLNQHQTSGVSVTMKNDSKNCISSPTAASAAASHQKHNQENHHQLINQMQFADVDNETQASGGELHHKDHRPATTNARIHMQSSAEIGEDDDELQDELLDDGEGPQDQFSSQNFMGAVANNQQQLQKNSQMGKFESGDCREDDLVDANGKRRGPRTTIKPKQLETLRKSFETTPKPSRHIREDLAAQTGLNMRVIQVWFQNRRSKERRMRNSNGSARRNFFRSSSRRLRVGPPAPLTTTGANSQATANNSLISMSAAKGERGNATSKQSKAAAAAAAAAAATAAALNQDNSSPLDTSGGQQSASKSNNSPSEFGGSSTGGSASGGGGGFTYFSDSSNQGNDSSSFVLGTPTAANQTTGSQQHAYSQSSSSATTNGLLHSPDSVGNRTPTGGPASTLMSLGSPSTGGGGGPGAPQPQYQTPPPPLGNHQIYQQQAPPPPAQNNLHAHPSQNQHHAQMAPAIGHQHAAHLNMHAHHHHHHHHHAHHAAHHQMMAVGAPQMQPSQPSGPPPSVVQW